MDIANNWTIVIAAATIVSMIFLWTKQAYLDPIRKREKEIIKKVKKDLSERLDNSKNLISKFGEEKFVDEIYSIIEFRKRLRDLKDTFGRRMIPIGLIICILAMIFVSMWSFSISWLNFLVPYLALLLLIMLISDFFSMRKNENLISRYLEGENPIELLPE